MFFRSYCKECFFFFHANIFEELVHNLPETCQFCEHNPQWHENITDIYNKIYDSESVFKMIFPAEIRQITVLSLFDGIATCEYCFIFL